MKGVILAAGKGSRLFPVTQHIPKPLLPLANRVTLAYAFDRLKEIGVEDICIVVGDNEPLMRNHLANGALFGVNLTYVRQDEPKGLAHAAQCAREFVGNDAFVMYLGDAIYSTDFKAISSRFLASGCANLNLLKAVPDPSRFGVANVDGERIVKLVEKPAVPESNLAMAGLYFFGPEIWTVMPDLKPSARGEYEITDAIQMLIDRGHIVLGGVYDGVWFDTGTLDSFLETSAFLIGNDHLLGPGCAVRAEIGQRVVVGDGARVEAKSIADCVILPGADVQVDGTIEHAILGGTVRSARSISGLILYDQ